ncbi:hypothetical protein APUTEX25_004302, partial [Auxenochlorella protothecoides]
VWTTCLHAGSQQRGDLLQVYHKGTARPALSKNHSQHLGSPSQCHEDESFQGSEGVVYRDHSQREPQQGQQQLGRQQQGHQSSGQQCNGNSKGCQHMQPQATPHF